MQRAADAPRSGAWQAKQSVAISEWPAMTAPGLTIRWGKMKTSEISKTRFAPTKIQTQRRVISSPKKGIPQ
jgi:hypothetical protein